MRIPTCTRVQSRFGEGLENRPGGCAGGCFVVGRTSEGKTWWPLVAAFIRGGTLRIPFEISPFSSPLSSFFSTFFSSFLFFSFLFSSFTSIVHVCTRRYTTKHQRGFVKKKLLPLRIFAIKGTAFVGSFHLIFHCRGKKNHSPVFTPTFGYLETHYRAPLREHGLQPFLKSYTISRIRAYPVYCVAHSGGTNDTPFVLLLFRLSRLRWMAI